MNNDDLDKQLSDAMGAPAEPTSTSKRTLKGPMVADKVISEPVRESFEEMKLRAKLEVLQELLAEERSAKKAVKHDAVVASEREPEEEVEFTVNLPVQSDCLRIDGREYYHGHTYKVRKNQAISMRDNQFTAWKHDEQVQGKRMHPSGFVTSGMTVNPLGQVMSRPVY